MQNYEIKFFKLCVMNMDPIPDKIEKMATETIDAAYKVHTLLGHNCWKAHTSHAWSSN